MRKQSHRLSICPRWHSCSVRELKLKPVHVSPSPYIHHSSIPPPDLCNTLVDMNLLTFWRHTLKIHLRAKNATDNIAKKFSWINPCFESHQTEPYILPENAPLTHTQCHGQRMVLGWINDKPDKGEHLFCSQSLKASKRISLEKISFQQIWQTIKIKLVFFLVPSFNKFC